MAAAHVGHSPPWELVKSQLCQFYHCLPSQLMDEPADEMILLWQVNSIYVNNLPKPKAAKRL